MSHISALVTLPYTSGLPQDVAVNTFHFDGDPGDPNDLENIAEAIANFYNTPGSSGENVAYYLAGLISRTASFTVQLYDMTQSKPRAPIYAEPFYLDPPGSPTSYPAELAICCSFQAVAVSGVPQARRRGRVFLGPLIVSTGTTTGGEFTRVSTAARSDIAGAAFRMATAAAADGVPWCVYSRINGGLYPVQNGWVDNDFDVQRRRGPDPTDRTVWTLSV